MLLDPQKCPFAPVEAVEQFNHLEECFARMEHQAPKLFRSSEVAALDARRKQLAERLQRGVYRVGFVGPAGAGKSATICSLVGMLEADGPTPVRSAPPTTNTLVRIRKAGPSYPPSLTLRYMSEQAFTMRKTVVCQALGLNNHQDIASLMDGLRVKINEGGNGDLYNSAAYLMRLLGAAEANPDIFGSREPRPVYKQRSQYVVFEPHDVARFALLGQVEVDAKTEWFPNGLELLDVPGLWTGAMAGDALSISILQEIDALIVMQPADSLSSAPGLKLLARLNDLLDGRFQQRSWLAVTFMDALQAEQVAPESKNNVFDQLSSKLAEYEFPVERTLLLGNGVFQSQLGASSGAAVARSGPSNAAESPLTEAYGEVLTDGGIARLRELVGGWIASAVREEIAERARGEINDVVRGVIELLQTRRRRSSMADKAVSSAVNWANGLRRIQHQLRRDRDFGQELARELKEVLLERVHEACTDVLSMHRDDLAEAHELLCRDLAQHAREVLNQSLDADASPGDGANARTPLQQVYAEIGGRLDEVGAGAMDAERSDAFTDPAQQWRAAAEQDLNAQNWADDPFSAFIRDQLFGVGRMKMEDYRSVMNRKVRCVVNRFIEVLTRRLDQRLDAYRREAGLLSLSGADIDQCSSVVYAELMECLHQLPLEPQ